MAFPLLVFTVCDTAAHKDCIPKSSACRASPGLRNQFHGTSPFRPNVSARNPFSKQPSTPNPPTLSPDLSKHRKTSAPGRMRSGMCYIVLTQFNVQIIRAPFGT